jgi:hypothetical protein
LLAAFRAANLMAARHKHAVHGLFAAESAHVFESGRRLGGIVCVVDDHVHFVRLVILGLKKRVHGAPRLENGFQSLESKFRILDI